MARASTLRHRGTGGGTPALTNGYLNASGEEPLSDFGMRTTSA